MRNLKLSSCVVALAGLLLTAPLATAQSAANDASTAERPTLWAGLGLETIVPFGSLGVSAPVGRVGTLTVAPRLGVDALLVLGPVVSADVLFSGADVGFYGGPSYYGGTDYYSEGFSFANNVSHQRFSEVGRGGSVSLTLSSENSVQYLIDSIDMQ